MYTGCYAARSPKLWQYQGVSPFTQCIKGCPAWKESHQAGEGISTFLLMGIFLQQALFQYHEISPGAWTVLVRRGV